MLIIGLGNLDRGDDAAGLLAVRRLNDRGIPAIAHAGSTLDLIELWTDEGPVIVIDAVVSNGSAGTVRMWDAHSTALSSNVFRSSTHEIGLADAVEISRALGRIPEQLLIYGIEAKQFVPGSSPTVEVLAGVDRAVEEIAALCRYQR